MEIDPDILDMNVAELRENLQKARDMIRQDYKAQGHNLCWYRPELWELDPNYKHTTPQIPPEDEFLEKCRIYRKSLDSSSSMSANS